MSDLLPEPETAESVRKAVIADLRSRATSADFADVKSLLRQAYQLREKAASLEAQAKRIEESGVHWNALADELER